MLTNVHTVPIRMLDSEVNKLAGTMLTEKHFDELITGDVAVYKPNGELLVMYRKDVLPANLCQQAYNALRDAAAPSKNRGTAVGVQANEEFRRQVASNYGSSGADAGKVRFRQPKHDGTLSRTLYAPTVNSGIVGYFDRSARTPYCRQTAFVITKKDRWSKALPFVQHVSDQFMMNVPDRYAAQQKYIQQTHPDFFIPGTVFTTVTVNKNWQTAVHQDQGDLKQGCGVMAVLQAGVYDGCYLCFPKYRVAVDMRLGGVCFADVHEWHGNTPLIGKPGRFERISCVFYYRQRMHECGSGLQEADRAKRRKPGDKLHGKV